MEKNNNVSISSKMEVFEAVVRAVMYYAFQVWVFVRFKVVEGLHTFL